MKCQIYPQDMIEHQFLECSSCNKLICPTCEKMSKMCLICEKNVRYRPMNKILMSILEATPFEHSCSTDINDQPTDQKDYTYSTLIHHIKQNCPRCKKFCKCGQEDVLYTKSELDDHLKSNCEYIGFKCAKNENSC